MTDQHVKDLLTLDLSDLADPKVKVTSSSDPYDLALKAMPKVFPISELK